MGRARRAGPAAAVWAWCLWLTGSAALSGPVPAAERGSAAHLTRQQLVGARRQVRIEISDASGPRVDPFYQADSVGIIVYDASGWMSCQIAAPHRRAAAGMPAVVPAWRVGAAATPEESQKKAAAFDTYYAYFGTWDYDDTTSVVTHHVESSLIPAETGLRYSQVATLEGGRLIFTVRDSTSGKETLRTKVWERLSRAAP